MSNVCVSFGGFKEVTPENIREGRVKPVFKYVRTHMIFDIKMYGKFIRKARLVAGVHNTEPPLYITYSSVVTRESVRLEILISGMNDLDVCA